MHHTVLSDIYLFAHVNYWTLPGARMAHMWHVASLSAWVLVA